MIAVSLCSSLPWLVSQTEMEMLFLSWPVSPAAIAGRLPPELSLETFGEQAWVTLIPFRMERLRMRGLPLSPDFAEVDCLTYVTYGGEPGIWFFRIDAATGFGSVMARTFFGLPYNHSAVSLGQEGDDRTLDCEGKAGGGGPRPELRLRYRPRGAAREAAPGTLEYFVVERLVMYSCSRRGTLLRGLEARSPRRIQDCDVALTRNTLLQAVGLPAPEVAPIAWYCARSDIRTWFPAPVTRTSR